MGEKQVYDRIVKRLNRALVVAFGVALFVALIGLNAQAQIHAAPPSVTSMGFGGHAISGISPSVTSLGPRGYTPGFNQAFPNSHPWFGVPNSGIHSHPGTHNGPHHRWGNGYWGGAYAVPYYYPYYGDNYQDYENEPADEQYGAGPTIFDRHGTGIVPQAAPEQRAEAEPAPAASTEAPVEASSQPQTVLVFKDGHQLEIQNYAIVGSTLYDLTDGHRRKVALSELDLTATENQNDDRGVDFQVPASSLAN